MRGRETEGGRRENLKTVRFYVEQARRTAVREGLETQSFLYLVGMCSVLVLCPVRGVAEGFGASRELASVWLLSCVRPQVSLEVFQS